MSLSPEPLLHHLWRDYTQSTPQAEAIHRLLGAQGEVIHNDHVALRSFAPFLGKASVGIAQLGVLFEQHGWVAQEDYEFTDKHLHARYWLHPDRTLPRVFISELQIEKLSPAAQRILNGLIDQLPAGFAARADLPWAGRPWQTSHRDYQTLLAESEYAAWMAAWGFRVNHFTVYINDLTRFTEVHELNTFLQTNGFTLNAAGGLVKGTPADCLEQSSTMATPMPVEFTDGTFDVPSCYYEFAKRYRLPTGELFNGFVPTSANRLFESTNVTAR